MSSIVWVDSSACSWSLSFTGQYKGIMKAIKAAMHKIEALVMTHNKLLVICPVRRVSGPGPGLLCLDV